MGKLILDESILSEEVSGEEVKQTVETSKFVMDLLNKGENKHKWMDTATKAINTLSDDDYQQVADILNTNIGDKKVDDKIRQEVANETDADLETANGWKTVSDILGYLDSVELAEKNPKALRGIILVILAVIAVIEPTPVGEAIAGIVALLPEKAFVPLMKFLGYLNPIYWIRKGLIAIAKKKDEKDAEKETQTGSLWGDYKEFDPEEWEDEDIEFWHTIDWTKDKDGEFAKEDDKIVGEVVKYGEVPGGEKKTVEMVKFFRQNPIYPPYYGAVDEPFTNCVGPMFDGHKKGKVDIHDRYETWELYDRLSR